MSEQDKRAVTIGALMAEYDRLASISAANGGHAHEIYLRVIEDLQALEQPQPPNERIAELERENERLRKACDAYSEAELLRGVEPRAHKWDGDGEHCTVCGQSDWMGGDCTPKQCECVGPCAASMAIGGRQCKRSKDSEQASLAALFKHWSEFGPEHGFGELIETLCSRLPAEPESSRGEIDELRWALRRIANMLDRDGNGIEMHAKEMQGIAAVALLPKLAPETDDCKCAAYCMKKRGMSSNPEPRCRDLPAMEDLPRHETRDRQSYDPVVTGGACQHCGDGPAQHSEDDMFCTETSGSNGP